jgi:DNA modification methylase
LKGGANLTYKILTGDTRDVLKTLPDQSVQCCVTSPPYFNLRDYGHDGQIGLEATPVEYVDALVGVFREVRRVLREDGTLWLNLGDSYANDGKWGGYTGGKHAQGVHGTLVGRQRRYSGLKPKDLIGIPWRVAFALQEDGWWLRSDIIWSKCNAMPHPVTDRPTSSHEHIFLLAKSEQYHYDHLSIQEIAVSEHGSGNGFVRPERLSFDGRGSDEPWTPKRQSRDNFKREDSKRGVAHVGQSNGTHRSDRDDTVPDGMRNKRDVWNVPVRPFCQAHFATFPPDLIRPCIRAGAPAGGVVLDPFNGAGTSGVVCIEEGRDYIGIEINPEYVAMSEKRLQNTQPPLFALVGDKKGDPDV